LATRNRLLGTHGGRPAEEDPRCAAIADSIARARELAEAPAADSNGLAGLQNVQAWLNRGLARPAVQRGLESDGGLERICLSRNLFVMRRPDQLAGTVPYLDIMAIH
jgi:hypothetical protein